MKSVLIIDDEPPIRRLLRLTLEPAGYRVFEAEAGQLGLQDAAAKRPDVVVLDLGLPDMDGLVVLQRLREWSTTPVLVLTVRNQEADKVAALDAGADDYLTKPFSTAELLARLRAIQRRAPEAQAPVFVVGDLTVDLAQRTVTVQKSEVHLTATEYALLHELVRHAGKVVTQKQLLRAVWGPKAEEQSQYLRVYITHLRKKLESNPQQKLIRTEAGIGYRLLAD
ncbi:MAG: KDP operon transcriptional regulatory protein KdpE [Verrucomicrobiae bacterium]|nr:KDP operon transcriptional regulatory protein KdpE [Verrucomicrobiae bacterium]